MPPALRDGIRYFADSWPEIDRLGTTPLLGPNQPALPDASTEAAVYQTMLAADSLRYQTLQVTGSKSSGHPGGFAYSADAIAALHLLGHRNMVSEVGPHAPGFYSAMFLDTSLEAMGIHTVDDLCAHFRERHGLLGQLNGTRACLIIKQLKGAGVHPPARNRTICMRTTRWNPTT